MDLSQLRTEIDAVDTQLIELLTRRMEISRGIGEYKLANGLPVLDPDREVVKLRSVGEKCRPETREYIVRLFEDIMRESRNYQADISEKK